jgi:hypothetical protein
MRFNFSQTFLTLWHDNSQPSARDERRRGANFEAKIFVEGENVFQFLTVSQIIQTVRDGKKGLASKLKAAEEAAQSVEEAWKSLHAHQSFLAQQ